jgi:hypothetical protein
MVSLVGRVVRIDVTRIRLPALQQEVAETVKEGAEGGGAAARREHGGIPPPIA